MGFAITWCAVRENGAQKLLEQLGLSPTGEREEFSELWRGGERAWWISHEGESGPKGLSVDGDPPECFASIRRELEEAQRAEGGDAAGVDYIFDIPLKVAQTLVGFKHDQDCPHISEEQFTVLSRSAPKKGFLGRLFST